MRKKLISFLLLMMICIGLVPNYSFAADKKEGKIIYISINRTNLDNLQEIPVLNKKLKCMYITKHLMIHMFVKVII